MSTRQEMLLKRSKEIFEEAVMIHHPDVVVMMFSGGDDSLTCYHVALQLGIELDFVLHGNTGCGIQETTEFARREVNRLSGNYIEASAGDTYRDYVLRKGFFGKGEGAHGMSYHVLKAQHFRGAISAHIVQRRRNVKILLVNGARRNESERRKLTMMNPLKIDPSRNNQIWVNLINDWEDHDCIDYLEGNGIKRNPVSVKLCRSGECMCGTMQTEGDRVEAAYFFPAWGKWLDELEKQAKILHGFGWNDKGPPKPVDPGQTELFQPMCTGCKVNYLKSNE